MLKRVIACIVGLSFALTSVSRDVYASVGVNDYSPVLPAPTQLLSASAVTSYPVLKGLKLDPKNPLNLEFIIDTQDKNSVDEAEARKLVDYFLAAVALPQNDL